MRATEPPGQCWVFPTSGEICLKPPFPSTVGRRMAKPVRVETDPIKWPWKPAEKGKGEILGFVCPSVGI
jgi:hypothetical protein